MDANFIDLVILSSEKGRSCTVKISPYECAHGFRRSRFLQELLSTTHSSQTLLESRWEAHSLVRCENGGDESVNVATVVEDSSSQDIRAALDFVHKVSQPYNSNFGRNNST